MRKQRFKPLFPDGGDYMGLKDAGYISVHRSIQAHWLWKETPFSYGQAWIDLLLLVNHKDVKMMLGTEAIVVERGSRILSIRQLCERWGWSNTKVSRFLGILENDEMLRRKSDTKKTLITIENYGSYQDAYKEKTSKKRQENVIKTSLKHTNNNDNTLNNLNIDKSIFIYGEFSNVHLSENEFKKLKEEYQDYDAKIEKLSLYKASTGKAYKSDYATIKSWARKDDSEKPNNERMRKEL